MNRLSPDERSRVLASPADFARRTVLEAEGQLDAEGRVEVVGVANAARHLARYLRRVEAGQVVVISRRGQPVAQLTQAHPRITTGDGDG